MVQAGGPVILEASDSIAREGGDPRPARPEAPIGAGRARFVLVQPSHTGNIGAAARAIRTMGFDGLSVVAPLDPHFRESAQALALASNATDVLRRAAAFESVPAALEGVNLAIAMTGYRREFGPPHVDLREAAARAARWLAGSRGTVAFVFGTERSGLLNQDVQRCQLSCAICADPGFSSLNLAQAVQVVAYALRCELAPALPESAEPAHGAGLTQDAAASVEQLERFYRMLEQALVQVGFHDPQRPRHLLARLRGLFARAGPTREELDILLGICAAIIEPKAERAGRKVGAAARPPR
jgi:tRNA/rRNA methyltransferase